MIANCLPTVLLGYVESDYGLAPGLECMSKVSLDDLPGHSLIAVFLRMSSEFVIKYIREPFEKTSGRMKSLNFGASVEPLMAQAASQSQVSSIEISRCSSGEVNMFWPSGIVLAVKWFLDLLANS